MRRVALLSTIALLGGLTAAVVGPAASAGAATVASVPRPDHVVIVVEENHSDQNIIGNAAAPYINSLASNGAYFSKFFAETHPSEPNYIALFSGGTQGVTDDSCPHTFSGANLGSQLADNNLGFAGYSEGLPSVGSTVCASGRYARKHNPWSNFSNLAPATNQPFSAFPSDYSTLPQVSFVIPNLDNDMHDGTIAQGDSWLQSNLGGYISWAQSHNSLFVLTFDEDDGGQSNQIPTIFAGQRVAPGTYATTYNHYNLLRTIEDAYGLGTIGASATASPILDPWTAPSGDQPPSPAFTSSCSGLSCSFDASGSSDPDGTISSYSWAFGDGATGSGQTANHTYAGGGAQTVTLTVTDDQGAAASVSHTVTPVAPAGSPFVSDTFNRTVNGGLGSADVGGAWTTSGPTSGFAVRPGKATLATAKGAQLQGYVGPSGTDTDLAVRASLDAVPIGGPDYLSVTARQVSTGNTYAAKVLVNAGGSVTLRLIKLVGGTETAVAGPITVAGLTYTAGTSLSVRVQATGTNPTTLRARLWPTAQSEPSTWPVSTTDATAALQAAGRVGLTQYLSGAATNGPVTLSLSSLVAQPTQPATNQAPVAAFTSSCSQLSCSFDGRGSSDADGTVSSYAWTFGDGATGTGATPTHAFVTGNTYSVTLTVTDNQGATGSVSHDVTATDPPPNQPPTARFTSSCSGLTCTFDGSASSDPEDVDVAGWSWQFGDGSTGSGETVPHTFAAAGTYTVTLAVIDDDGATGTVQHDVTVTAAANTSFVSDTFARTVSAGLGRADVGGAWTVLGGASGFAVANGTATITPPRAGVTLEAYVGPTQTDADLMVTVALDKLPTGGPTYLSVTGRRVSAGNTYFAKALVNPNGSVTLQLVRLLGGTQTILAGPITLTGVTYAPGAALHVRVQVTGTAPTTVRARAWVGSQSEPASWLVSATDSSAALQAAGTVGLSDYQSSATTNVPVVLQLTQFDARPTTGA